VPLVPRAVRLPTGPRLRARGPSPVPIPPDELNAPRIRTVLRLIWNTIAWVFRDPAAMGVAAGFLVLMIWGWQGRLEIVREVWDGWRPFADTPGDRARIIPGIPWDQEWLSFWVGALLLVGVPALLIKRVYRHRLSDYGLGPPAPGRWRLTLLSAALLFVFSLPLFLMGARDEGMRCSYPLYRGGFQDNNEILIYELGYFPFFLAIEFIFRGFLLFGLYHAWRSQAKQGEGRLPGFGYYAILLSMLSYTAWHLGKPLPELWGTLVWGLASGTVALASGTIWPIIIVHWLLNVVLDMSIWLSKLPVPDCSW
jgi:hypothetical protein